MTKSIHKKKWFTTKVEYPPKLYSYAIWFQVDGRRLMYFMHQMYQDLSNLYFEAMLTIREVKNTYGDQATISSSILIIPCNFDANVYHKKKYWQKRYPKKEILFTDRISAYIDAVNLSPLYQVLVTPYINDDGLVTFSSAIPLKKGVNRDLETFMLYSNHPVSQITKNSALYSIEEPYGYDLTSNKIVENPPLIS